MKYRCIPFFLFLAILSVNLHASDTVRVGAIFGLTGDAALSDVQHLEGARFAVEKINRHGGLMDRPITLMEFDNSSTALGSRAAAEKAAGAGVVAVIGCSWSSHSLAAAPVLQAAGIPMISPMSTNPDLTRVGGCIFRVCFTDDFQGRVMAAFARQNLKIGRAAVLTNESTKYGPTLAGVFISEFRKQGGTIIWEGAYLQDSTDFTPLLKKIAGLRPEAIFLPGYLKDSALIIKKARELGIHALFLGGDGWGAQMYEFAGSELDGNYFSVQWHKDSPTKKSRRFVKEYQQRYSEIKSIGSAMTYDAVMLLADAVRRAESLDPSKIRDALAATKGFKGVAGEITFDANRNPIGKPAVILRLEKGTAVYVKTITP